MYNFESDSSLIIYVSRRNRQTAGVFYLGRSERPPAAAPAAAAGSLRACSRRPRTPAARRSARVLASHVYPFNAQFPYNLTLRSKRNFAKSFPAAGGGCERDAHIGVLEIKCWAKLVTLRLSISKPIRSKVCAKMTSKGNHTLGRRRPRPAPPAPYLNPPCLWLSYWHATDNSQVANAADCFKLTPLYQTYLVN